MGKISVFSYFIYKLSETVLILRCFEQDIIKTAQLTAQPLFSNQ